MTFITKRRLVSLVSASAMVATLALAAAPAAALAAVDPVTPSTNDVNRGSGMAHVDVTAVPGSATLTLTSTQGWASCFEYRTDSGAGQALTENAGANYNNLVTDGLYPYECVNNSTKTVTVLADELVEVRMVFGAEADERFDWTAFEVPQPTCTPTGWNGLTAAKIGGAVTGSIDATGCDIAVYNPTSVTNADISGALWYGVVANGGTVSVTGSRIHHIGDVPFNGVQRGIGIYFTGASGTISGNAVSQYQKGGIVAKNGGNVTISDNTVTGLGPVAFIAQNGIQVSFGTSARLFGNNVSLNTYTPGKVTATGLLIYKAGGVSGASKSGISYIKAENNFHHNETNIANYGKGGAADISL